MPKIHIESLKKISAAEGLQLIAFTDVSPIAEARKRLLTWQEKGYAAEMSYMQRDAELLSNPGRLLSNARTLLSFALPYAAAVDRVCPRGFGRIARYARGKDYHRILKKLLRSFDVSLREQCAQPLHSRIFVDAVPMLERAFAEKSGLGFIGKNTMLIRPGLGSFFFLAEYISDLEVESGSVLEESKGSCGACSRCLDQCPTSAFESPYELNAGKCISYLSIEKRGIFSFEESKMLGDWIFGCDICQEVCPFNHTSLKLRQAAAHEGLEADNGSGDLLSLKEVLGIDHEEGFLQRFAGTPLMRAKRSGLLRNALSVAANQRFLEAEAKIQEMAVSDSCEIVRNSALRTLICFAEEEGMSAARRGFLEGQIKEGNISHLLRDEIDRGLYACLR